MVRPNCENTSWPESLSCKSLVVLLIHKIFFAWLAGIHSREFVVSELISLAMSFNSSELSESMSIIFYWLKV